MSVYSNGNVFTDGTILGAETNPAQNVPEGLNEAFADALSLTDPNNQTIAGPVTFNGLLTSLSEAKNTFIFTGSGNYAVGATDRVVVINKTIANAGPTKVTLPSQPEIGRLLSIKDGRGDSATNPITVVGSQNMDAQTATGGFILNAPYASVELIYNGLSWNVIGGYGFDAAEAHAVYVENVRSHGAVGDGVADDTLAIQAAAAAIPNGGTLYFPPGRYLISASTGLPSNCVVVGPATIVAAAASKWGGGVGSAFTNNNGENISVRDLQFSYPYGSANYGGGNAYVLYFTNTANVLLSGLIVDGGACLAYMVGTNKTSVSGCQATNVSSCGIQHLGGAQTAAVFGNYISLLSTAGAGASGIAFEGINIDGSQTTSTDFKAFGNTIYLVNGSGGAGVLVQGHALGGGANKITITSNHIQLSSIAAYGIQVTGYSSNGLIHDNFLEGCTGTDAAILTGASASNYTIANNRIDNWQAGSGGVMAIAATTSIICNNAATNSSSPLLGTFDATSRQYNNSLAGVLASYASYEGVTVLTSGSNYNVTPSDRTIVVNKTSGSATTLNLPATAVTGLRYSFKDGKGDAATNNITVSGNGNNIDGGTTAVINQAYGAIDVVFNGSTWSVF